MKKLLVTMGLFGIAAVALVFPGYGDDGAEQGKEASLVAPAARIDPHMITGLLSEGRPDSALSLLNTDEHAGTMDPMVYLLRARTMRDKLADEDDDKDLIKSDGEAIIKELEQAIAICDRALDSSSGDPAYYYYRGRAWLATAQIHTLTRSYWSAGRSAGKAKSNLEKFLEYEPDHPDAQGDLGAFLYFADTLPGIIKFVSKILRFPSGDRERGLQMLHYAAAREGVFKLDYQIALAAIYLLFEGRFEQGVGEMQALIERHPHYTRLVEPLGVLAPLDPMRIREFQRIEDLVIARHMTRGHDVVDWSLVKRIQLHRAYSNMFFLSPAKALNEFTRIVDSPTPRPDWVLPLALINRGYLYGKRGDSAKALEAFELVASRKDMAHFHDLANGLIESMEKPWKTIDLEDLNFVGSIYDGNVVRAKAGLDDYKEKYGRDVTYYFYLGELESFAQDLTAAAVAYKACLNTEVYGGDQSYQMFAALRLAEIRGHERKYKEARKYIEEATEYTHAGYLLDFMINSRQRFYELLDEGKLAVAPSLFVYRPMDRSAAPRADQH